MCHIKVITLTSLTQLKPGIQFPSDNEDEEMTYDQESLIRRFRKGRRPGTASGTGRRRFEGLPGGANVTI
jgi:hypothetical protein